MARADHDPPLSSQWATTSPHPTYVTGFGFWPPTTRETSRSRRPAVAVRRSPFPPQQAAAFRA